MLLLKKIFKNKKIYFNVFLNKKYFKLLPLSQSQTYSIKTESKSKIINVIKHN